MNERMRTALTLAGWVLCIAYITLVFWALIVVMGALVGER